MIGKANSDLAEKSACHIKLKGAAKTQNQKKITNQNGHVLGLDVLSIFAFSN